MTHPNTKTYMTWVAAGKANLAVYTLVVLMILPLVAEAAGPGLLRSASEGDPVGIRAALAAGSSLERTDEKGRTPLMLAAMSGSSESVKLLLAAGATPQASDRLARTALHLAISAPIEVSRLLIAAGADVNRRNAGGVSPLMQAAGAGSLATTRFLLARQARVDLKDYQGMSVVDWARRGGNREIEQLIGERVAALGPAPVVEGDDFAEDVFVDVTYPKWFKRSFLDLQEDLEEALDGGKKGLLVFISTHRCSYCKAFIDRSLDATDIRQRVQASFDVIGLDIFDDSEMVDPAGKHFRVKEYVAANKAAFTPTLIFYGADGRKLLKIVGYYPAEKFRSVLDYIEGDHYERVSLRTFMHDALLRDEDEKQAMVTDHDLFAAPPYDLDRSRYAAEQPLLVVFEATGCPSCRRFHQDVLADTSVRRLIRDYEAVQLDVGDSSTALVTPKGIRTTPSSWFEELGLSYTPAIVFFDHNGAEVLRLDSETRQFRLEGSLQLVLQDGHVDDRGPQLQRWRKERALELFREETDVEKPEEPADDSAACCQT